MEDNILAITNNAKNIGRMNGLGDAFAALVKEWNPRGNQTFQDAIEVVRGLAQAQTEVALQHVNEGAA